MRKRETRSTHITSGSDLFCSEYIGACVSSTIYLNRIRCIGGPVYKSAFITVGMFFFIFGVSFFWMTVLTYTLISFAHLLHALFLISIHGRIKSIVLLLLLLFLTQTHRIFLSTPDVCPLFSSKYASLL